MANVSISRKPTAKVASFSAPARGKNNRTFTSAWKLSSWATASGNAERATGVKTWWHIAFAKKVGKTSKLVVAGASGTISGSTAVKQSSVNLNWFKIGSRVYQRSYFYPLGTPKIKTITCEARLANPKGVGPSVTKGCTLKVPGRPKVATPTFDVANGRLRCVVTAAADSGLAERYDTRYQFRLRRRGTDGTWADVENRRYDSSSTAASINFVGSGGHDVTDWQGLEDGECYLLEATAWSRGLAGDSDKASSRLVVGPPNRAGIGDVRITSAGSEGLVVVGCVLNKYLWWTHKDSSGATVCDFTLNPVTGCRLQALANVTYEDASTIPADAQWVDVSPADDGGCTALSAPASDLVPDAGKWTWLRIKTWRFDEQDGLIRYSSLRRLDELHSEAPTGSDDECGIVSLTPGADGESAVCVIGYDPVGGDGDDATGTELSWSADEDAWESTDQPRTFEVTWSSVPAQGDPGYGTWGRTQRVIIRGLDEGERVYVRARRYLTDEETTTYGAYCIQRDVTPVTRPASVTLGAPSIVAEGADLALTWTFDGGATQRTWAVLSSDGTELANGTDATGSCTLAWDRYSQWVEDGSVALSVRVSTGGDPTTSPEVTVRIAQPPTVSVEVGETLTAQPLSMTVTASEPCMLSVVVSAMGVAGGTAAEDGAPRTAEVPFGMDDQGEGDDVWSEWADGLVWSEETIDDVTVYTTTVTAPTGLDLRQNGTYEVSVRATDQTAGLTSEIVTSEFAVAWAHRAPVPSEPEITPYDVTDEDGVRTRGCAIQLAEPARSLTPMLSHDLADVYDATDNPEGYWASGSGYISADCITPLDDGWAHVEYENTGTNVKYVRMFSAATWQQANAPVTPEGTYTALMEVREVSYTGAPYVNLVTGTSNTPLGMFSQTVTRQIGNIADGELRGTTVARDSFDNCVTCMRTVVCVPAGASVSMDMRVSLYEGEYDGPYAQPSTDTQAAGDVYDLYRLTPDGPYLVAEGVAADGHVDDPYAPYGGTEKGYRIASRTADGDVDWLDFPYELPGSDLRIDYGGEYVELPFNLSISDTFEKDFEARQKLDGSTDGYWGRSASRSAGMSTDVIRIEGAEVVRSVRALARHAGACFVRTPDGCAYMADVQVTSLGTSADSCAASIALDATEVDLTSEYMAAVTETEEGEG